MPFPLFVVSVADMAVMGLVITSATHHNWWANWVRLVLLEAEAFIRLHAFDK
jgi:hypothetical protein